MAIESDGHSRGNPRLYELIENAPKVGKSPTIWAWPEVVDWLRIAGQPVPGPWPPHQQPRPNPEEESLPVAVAEPPRPEDAAPPTAPAQQSTYQSSSSQSSRWPDAPEDEIPPARRGLGWQDS
jgi:hypothetical protein